MTADEVISKAKEFLAQTKASVCRVGLHPKDFDRYVITHSFELQTDVGLIRVRPDETLGEGELLMQV